MTGQAVVTQLRLATPQDSIVFDKDAVLFDVRGRDHRMVREHAMRSPKLTEILKVKPTPGYNYYFIDRDPEAFSVATSYLRDLDNWTGFRDHKLLGAIWREAVWLQVPELEKRVKEIIQENRPPILMNLVPSDNSVTVELVCPEELNMRKHLNDYYSGSYVDHSQVTTFMAEMLAASESDGYKLDREMKLPGQEKGSTCYMFRYDIELHTLNLLRAQVYQKSPQTKPVAMPLPSGAATGTPVKAEPGSSPAPSQQRPVTPESPTQESTSPVNSGKLEKKTPGLTTNAKEFQPARGKGRK